MKRFLLCRYHEISLKRKKRPFFEKRLVDNIKKALNGTDCRSVDRLSGRIAARLGPDAAFEDVVPRLQRVFGVVSCSPAWLSSPQLESLKEDLWSLVRNRAFRTFQVRTRRAQKNFPLTSQEINEQLGAWIQAKSGMKVQLKDPDLTCYLDLVDGRAFLYFEKLRGSGGLPASTSGKVVVLLSGGIDSPVAAYKIMKRGCQALFVHFHSFPHTTLESQEKVRQLVRLLDQYQYGSKLWMVPFAECQRRVVAFSPAEVRVILYRRLMVQIAERLAGEQGARALVTGDSIGQVASQTLENLSAISAAAQMPILRPLVGEDKQEIIEAARQIGTFQISIQPDVDCCSLFVPRHPETRAQIDRIRQLEDQLEMEGVIAETMRRTTLEKIDVVAASRGRALASKPSA